MDRSWMSAPRLSDKYEKGVDEFIKFAVENALNKDSIACPCWKCRNAIRLNPDELKDHLIVNWIKSNYTCWSKHGETQESSEFHHFGSFDNMNSNFHAGDIDNDYCSYEIPNTVEDEFSDDPEMLDALQNDAETPLYEGCSKFTRLEAVVELFKLKAASGWTDKSFSSLLNLLSIMMPENNVLPNSFYEAKKMFSSIGLSYKKIHACPKDCILYRNEYASLDRCPKCNENRFKKKFAPAKIVWYFPIIPRFRRLFQSKEEASLLRWHHEGRIKDGKLRHPVDSPRWKKIDRMYGEFGADPRNLRLALASDGINPHSQQSTTHSTWPVLLMIYNLPPWLCMKHKYMMLSLLISGPRQPSNDIDVYLAPLVEDLKLLWEKGVLVYDGYTQERFKLKAMLFGTINDFPAYGNLSGYTVKGKNACPVCCEGTETIRLHYCMKNVYMAHRRWLPTNHPFRKKKVQFDGTSEECRAPPQLTGIEVFDKVKNIETIFGKEFAKEVPTCGWKKKSIFFELDYWKHLHVRHFLDVMHIQKNVCESLVSTLMNVKGKSKDTTAARLDLVKMGLRKELAPEDRGKKGTYLPPAVHTLSKHEKRKICESLHSIKVPEGFSSNIKNIVSLGEMKLKGLKSHDYHVLMENFLPVAIRSVLPNKVRVTITKLCLFFKVITSKVIDPEKLSSLQSQIVVTLCELEMYFPPSFFDIMIHLIIHLVHEIKTCGTVHLRWMYPVERYMKVLKGYVKSRCRPEGCIAERYIVEEAADFYAEYVPNSERTSCSGSRHIEKMVGEGIGRGKIITIQGDTRDQAHLYVLHNTLEVLPYVEQHHALLKSKYKRLDENLLTKEHNQTFMKWFHDHINEILRKDQTSVSERILWLSRGPLQNVFFSQCSSRRKQC